MFKKRAFLMMLVVFFVFFMVMDSLAMKHEKVDKKAIVVAQFGTTYPSALKDLTNIKNCIQKSFPNIKVKIAFTSNIIRRIWHNRRNDPKYANKKEFEEFLYVKGPLATIADLQDEGYKTIIVQPTHIYAGEEFYDLCSYVKALNSIETIKPKYKPFNKVVIGRPLLGMPGPKWDYHKDLEIAAKALRDDVRLAKKKKAVLVYMGHGNEYFSTGAYIEFQKVMRKMYPKVFTVVGTVEGFPTLEDVVSTLVHIKAKRVVLKPFMIVAGDHALNDMAGDEKDSWKNVIKSHGIEVYPVLKGLGENDRIAKIFVKHIKDVARANHISLR